MPKSLMQSDRTELETRVREAAMALLGASEKCCANKAAHLLTQRKESLEKRGACTIHEIRGSGREVRITVSSQNVSAHTPVTVNLKRVAWKDTQVASAAA